MKIQVLKIGRPAHQAYADLVDVYIKRLKPVWKVEDITLKAQAHQERSGKEIYARLGWSALGTKTDPGQTVVVLDERGQGLSSPELAQFMQKQMNQGICKTLSFVIGGPFGLSEDLRKSADVVWSLSPAVFPSDLAWLAVWEQLYRASSIIKGTGYHHE